MISKIAGTNSNTATKNKIWWAKLAVALILSNLLFFLLFSGNETAASSDPQLPDGWVEIQIQAELLTPFQSGKKVLLLQRQARKRIEAMLENHPTEPGGRFTVLVREEEAAELLKFDTWEIIPFLKSLSFAPITRGEIHEIRY
jgi:hypothetical protein